MLYLGIDTSNYTTSAAVYNNESGEIKQKKKLLTVKEGELGLRQSDAVFQHVINLPDIIKSVLPEEKISAVGVSICPDEVEGSYMPCFMTGKGSAEMIAAALGVPVRYFSHQAGHITAALYSAGRTDLIKRDFIAFHVSGGTTQVLRVKPDNTKIYKIEKVASSLDLKAGQAIDRVGKMLGIPFPAGPELDRLSRKSFQKYKVKPYMKNGCCSLSGLQNKCIQMKDAGEKDEDIAFYCINFIYTALKKMTDYVLNDNQGLPIVYSGGVMSNSYIREKLSSEYDAVFAAPGFSSDNAVGTAVLASF